MTWLAKKSFGQHCVELILGQEWQAMSLRPKMSQDIDDELIYAIVIRAAFVTRHVSSLNSSR